MEIEKIDKNFAIKTERADGMKEYRLPCAPFDFYGVFYDENEGRFLRMDAVVANTVNEGVAELNKHTSGGRIRFSTDSDVFELEVSYSALDHCSHMALFGSGAFTLLEETEAGEMLVGVAAPQASDANGYHATIWLGERKMRNYVLYFPLYNDVKKLSVALRSDAKVSYGNKYRDILPILYGGSSITQGGCASRPDTCYTALICKWNDIDFINLGFSGSFRGEQALAEYIAEQKCSLFVYDYDHNAPTAEHLRDTHYKFYQTFRRGQPTTPILMISRPDGARAPDGEERYQIIRRTYLKAKKNGDRNVYLIDGRTFYGKKDYDICSVDAIHPTDLGFYKMATKIYKKMQIIDKKFK